MTAPLWHTLTRICGFLIGCGGIVYVFVFGFADGPNLAKLVICISSVAVIVSAWLFRWPAPPRRTKWDGPPAGSGRDGAADAGDRPRRGRLQAGRRT